ncbi:tetratricopeptide repeat protein [Dactylosporangium sp. NPDC048998]|uniref:tetratricopeptide repeat protein n=1 Tax=Dactylosporangium sp. NPDC048998 TaxID=3363976 RepID=UPI00371AA37F
MSDLVEASEKLNAGDLSGAIRTLLTAAADAPTAELAAILARAGRLAGFDDLAEAADAVVSDPRDAVFLYQLGWTCIERGISQIAIPLLEASLDAAPGHRRIVTELAAAYEDAYRYGDAVAVLEANDAGLEDWPDRYLLAFYSVMSGDLDRARQAAARLAPAPQDWVHARGRLSGMLERAATVPGPLDQQALRPWHYVLNGGVLLHLSPYGFDEPMRGRYAYLHDSLAALRRTIDRLRVVLEAAGPSASSVSLLPDRGSSIFGLALASALGLPAQPYAPGRRDTIIAAYDLSNPATPLPTLAERAPGALLVEHATSWTDPGLVAPDATGLLYQSLVPAWGEHMRFPPGGEPEQVPADDRPAEALAAAVLETAPDEDEVAPGDTPADLATFAAGLAAGWPLIGRRDRLWSPGPVPSARFL